MTGLLHEREFSRTRFLKGGGGLIVGFSLLRAGLARSAGAAEIPQDSPASPFASNGPFDQYAVDSWITINADNTATIRSGAIRQGTGSDTGVMMIAAEELYMDMSQMVYVDDDTDVTPNTGTKDASNTITNAGAGVRAAAATAHQALLSLASAQLGVPVGSLSVQSGVVSGGGQSVSYGDLLAGKLFNVEMPASYNMAPSASGSFSGGIGAGVSPAKPVSQYTIVGTSPPRIEVPAIVTGALTYIQNVYLPGMLHGRIVRPRGQMLYGFGAPVVSVDESSISHIPGARVLQKGNFLGVVAPAEYDAIEAAAVLKVIWADPPAALPGNGNEFAGLRALDSAGKTVESTSDLEHLAPNSGNVPQALASAAHVVAESFGWHTNSHTPIGAQCAVADVTAAGARVFSGTQGSYKTRAQVSSATGLPLNLVRVTAVPMGGCFGNGCQYSDCAESAALMSQMAGAPVRVQYMRWDEIGWDQTAPGTLMDIKAGTDANGNLVAWNHTQFYPQYKAEVTETSAELAGQPIAQPSSSISGNFWPGPMYNIPNTQYLVKSVPLQGNWFKADWMRAGSSPHTTFAGEQVIDELAHAVGMDPVAFRIQNVTQGAEQPYLLAVLNAVTQAANWQPKVSGSQLSDATIVSGRGVAWSNVYGATEQAAAVADIQVNKKTGKISVNHIYAGFSTGYAVNPGLVENQMVGGVTQIISRLLVEELRYTSTHVTSLDFVTYPLLRFMDAPTITTILVQQTGLQPQKAGEPVTIAAPAAIANAFFDATGVRMRTAPLTPARVRAALAASGAGTAGLA